MIFKHSPARPKSVGSVLDTRRSLLLALLGSIVSCVVIQQVDCSIPIDYILYTSQKSPSVAQPAQTEHPLLPSLNSIYKLSQGDSKLDRQKDELANQVLNIVKNSSHKHNEDLVDLDTTRYAWHIMEKQALLYMKNRVVTIKPFINEFLLDANVSSPCKSAISYWLDRASELDQWAILMWNAWGDFPPAGAFEGSFTDLGSYRGCLSVPDNDIIGQAQYCNLDFQPLVPTRTRFHSIQKRVLDVDEQSGFLTGGDIDVNHRNRSKIPSHEFTSHRLSPKRTANISNSAIGDGSLNLRAEMFKEVAKRAQFFYYVKLRIGTCLPSKCSREDVQRMAQAGGARAVLQASKTFCVTKNDREELTINKYQWVAIVILTGAALITIVASLLDISLSLTKTFQMDSASAGIEVFEGFMDMCSLKRNAIRLFSSSNENSMSALTTTMTDGKQQQLPARQLTCLHGLKFISMIWVIYGHTLLFTDYQSFTHAFKIIDNDVTNFFMLPLLNPNYSVDTFFVISGLLSAYIIFSLDVKFNGILYTIARYIRLTPQLVIVILLFFLMPLLGDGPLYRQFVGIHTDRCYKNWWVDLLYLQSYVDRENICIISSWWLSNEMTFHLISLIVIYTLFKRPKLGMLVNFAVIFIMSLIGSIIHYRNGYAIQYLPSIPQQYEIETEQTQNFFHRPYPHAVSYFIGVALGYILSRRSVNKLSRFQLYQGWFMCILGFTVSLWGTYYWNQGAAFSQLEATIYYNTCQILWPISVAWVILACSLGHGGPVNSLLGAQVFAPLGRITYMTYLSHILVIYYYAGSTHQTIEPSTMSMMYICIANIFLSLVLGTVLSLVYEAPLLNLQKMILRMKYSRVKSSLFGTQLRTNGHHDQSKLEPEIVMNHTKANNYHNLFNNNSKH